jgi:serine/threonine protein kinase
MSSVISAWEKGPSLGAGSFGQVQMVYDSLHSRALAVKWFHKEQETEAEIAGEKEAFAREYEVLGLLADTPHVPRCHFVSKEERKLALSFHRGMTLFAEVEWSYKAILSLAKQVLEVFASLHRRNLIYADFKPDNVLFDGQRLVILDYNSIFEKGQPFPYEAAQNIFYRAPEAFCRDSLSCAIDIWSLGVQLFELYAEDCFIPGDVLTRKNIVVQGKIVGHQDVEEEEILASYLSNRCGYTLVPYLASKNKFPVLSLSRPVEKLLPWKKVIEESAIERGEVQEGKNLISLLDKMLCMKRASAVQLLAHPLLQGDIHVDLSLENSPSTDPRKERHFVAIWPADAACSRTPTYLVSAGPWMNTMGDSRFYHYVDQENRCLHLDPTADGLYRIQYSFYGDVWISCEQKNVPLQDGSHIRVIWEQGVPRVAVDALPRSESTGSMAASEQG